MVNIEDVWLPAVIKQGCGCRNCNNKAYITFHKYDIKTGKEVFGEKEEGQELEVYKLCDVCSKKIKNAKDIRTYRWTYDRLKRRDEKRNRSWHSKVYGGG